MKKHISTFAWFLVGLAGWFGNWGGMYVSAQQETGPASDGRIMAGLLGEIGFSVPENLQKNLELLHLQKSQTPAGTLSENGLKIRDPKLRQTAGTGETAGTEKTAGKQRAHRADIIPAALPNGKNEIQLTGAEEPLETVPSEGPTENAVLEEPASLELADLMPLESAQESGTPNGSLEGLPETQTETQTETVSEVLAEDPFSEAPAGAAGETASRAEPLTDLGADPENGFLQNSEIQSAPVEPAVGQNAAPLAEVGQNAQGNAERSAELVPLETLEPLGDVESAPLLPQPRVTPVGNGTFTEAAQETSEVPEMGLKAAEPQSAGGAGVIQGNGKPGETALEGIQVARLTVEKTAPEEIQVGTPSTWTITVRNEGKTAASGVQIHDTVPEGTQLVNTQPPARVSEDGEITWNVGTMPAGTMAVVKMVLRPTREGEIGSIASVSTRSEASAKAVATRPLLKVETFGEKKVLLGEPVELSIVVSNPGTGIARNVVLSETVPPELQFEGGAELLYPVGDLLPGESKTTKLPLTAVRPGKFANRILARSESDLEMESVLEMEVTAPAISLKLQGPSRRFLEKESTFRLTLSNLGTASAKNAEFYVTVPNGWKFVRANNLGTFLPEYGRTVWKLEELEAGGCAEAEVVLAPMEIGSFTLQCEANADICQPSADSKNVTVEGIAALMFQVVDSNDPIQVGEDTQYTVEVVNQGSRQAENVQVTVNIPAGLELVACEERARTARVPGGKRLLFEQIPTLGPKAAKVYRFTLRGVASGDQRVSVDLSSREFQDPIVKEESTRVFAE